MGSYLKVGVDVSSHQGTIDWKEVSKSVDFAILRAGYGERYDNKINENANGCSKNGIPYGLYWFSYAFNEEDAIKEANLLCNIADSLNPSYPLCFDLEYECLYRMKEHNINPTEQLLTKIARAFLNEVEKRGYYAMIYSSQNMVDTYYKSLLNRYDLWLASWATKTPPTTCGIWQASNKAKIGGISTTVDYNYAYKDYEKIKTKPAETAEKISELSKEIAAQIFDELDKVKVEILMERVAKIISKYI